ncbi:MAG: glycoside hydrolase family 2 TIM barrel-domain containing protein, partial [Candidatus Cryptobacteroides sp.]
EVVIGKGSKIQDDCILKINDPVLWTVDSPFLYRVETEILDSDNRTLDSSTVLTGIRETHFDPDRGFFLNGENMKIKGVCLHHDAGSLGAAVPESVWRRRLLSLKSIGVNAIRMSHNPQSPYIYDMCDELGFLVMDEAFDEWEFPKKKWIEGWNVGENPSYHGSSSFFDKWAETDLESMILRDRNHPSIILWSIGNEVDYPNDPYSHPILDYEGINQYSVPGYQPDKPRAERIGKIAKRLVKVVKKIDTSRAVTGAMAGVVMSNHTEYPYLLDVTGYNYTENRYAMDHETYPDRIIYGSENRHEYPYWQAVKDNDYISGQFLWTGVDYLGEAGPYPSRGFICGLLDLGGFIKPRGYYRKSLWDEKPMVYAGTFRKSEINSDTLLFDAEPIWNYSHGDTIRLAVFSNCQRLSLFLNEKEVEAEWQNDSISNAKYIDLEFVPGKVCLKGINNDNIVAEYTLYTHGKAESVHLLAEYPSENEKNGIIHVIAEIVDKEGHRVLDSRDRVDFMVDGGRLIKLENADPFYTGRFDGNSVPAYMGRVLAYIQADNPDGRINLNVFVSGVGEASLQ